MSSAAKMTFKEFLSELSTNKSKRVEGELIKTIFYSILTSFILLAVLYFIKLKSIDNFTEKFGLPILLMTLSISLIAATIRQVRAYRDFACMPGMMIGMTSGMIGFLPGFYVASTNGMFIGSFFGVAIGIFLGIYNGKCCGIMGIIEGIMAGFMGGLMGGMTAFMLLNDNLKAASILVFIISASIMLGLNYMIYIETKETDRQRQEDHFITIALTFILIAITTWLIAFGPRSAIFQ